MTRLRISHRRTLRVLMLGVLLLLIAHAALMLWHYRVAAQSRLLLSLFDLDQEHNLPTFMAGLLLLLTAQCGWLLSRREASRSPFLARYWMWLALGLFLLSLDEVAGLHEAFNMLVDSSWAWFAAPAVLALGLAFAPFLRALPRSTAVPLLLSGVFYFAGAVGVEIFGNSMVAQGREETLGYAMAVLVEEGAEFAGVLLCLQTLLHELASGKQPLSLFIQSE
jgi:hypothetical protein